MIRTLTKLIGERNRYRETIAVREETGLSIDMALVVASILTSLVVIPGVVLYLFTVRGVPTSSAGYLGAGVLAMLPGLMMGATALWVAARG
ncbi:hypothetical protein [Natronobacterium texcoconense]|uniref:Uncharacterized protein n=1 Tax=Natronobacterium texcoconense TaxID=1095778 RepID=A0A1H0ZV61_NATTX|nr:hypothetical protein [Natronobacterium texcoconense]SDQ31354.1 hypothetical protein SAMN04489842_0449 [Natronobacterium texcoconense]